MGLYESVPFAGTESRLAETVLFTAFGESLLAEIDTAYGRIDALLRFEPPVIEHMIRVVAELMSRTSLSTAEAWVEGSMPGTNIEEQSPPARVWSRRVMAARAGKDSDLLDALLAAVLGPAVDPVHQRVYVRDLFCMVLDHVEYIGRQASNPASFFYQLHHAIKAVRDSHPISP